MEEFAYFPSTDEIFHKINNMLAHKNVVSINDWNNSVFSDENWLEIINKNRLKRNPRYLKSKPCISFFSFLFKDFNFREKGREGEREGEKHQCGVASHATHYWGPDPWPRHVPRLGIEPTTLWFTGLCSIHRAMPARA